MASYPKTPQELFQSDWNAKIRSIVVKFRLNEPVEDTMGDIFMLLVKRDYLSKWNPALGGSFPTYIYKFVSNICLIKYHRSHTVGGLAIEGAFSIMQGNIDDENGGSSFVPGTIDEARLRFSDTPDTDSDASYDKLVQEIERILSNFRYKEHSYGEWEGKQIPRSMLQVFRYIEQEDLDVKEIAERFQTSAEFVYSLIRKMQTVLRESHLSKTYNLENYGKKRVSK